MTSVWLALKFVVVWLALRVSLPRAVLAVVAMVIVSTTILIASEFIVPTSLPLLLLLIVRAAAETAIESAVLVWGFRVGWSPKIGLLFVANLVALALSVYTAMSSDIERLIRAGLGASVCRLSAKVVQNP